MGIFSSLLRRREERVEKRTYTMRVFKEFEKIRHSIPQSDYDTICDGDIFSDEMEDSLKRVFTPTIDVRTYYRCLCERGEILDYPGLKIFLERLPLREYNNNGKCKYVDVRGAFRRLFLFFIGKY